MRIRTRIIATIAALAMTFAMTGMLTACGSLLADGRDNNTLTVAWWGNQRRNERQSQVNALFERANAGVTIKGRFSEWDDYWKKLATDAAGGHLPDVIAIDYSYLRRYVDNGLLVDLGPYIADGTIDTSAIDANALAAGALEGGTYALSLGSVAPALIYDKTLLDSAGIDMPATPSVDDFIRVSRQVYERTGVRTNFRYYEASELLEYMLRGKGMQLFADGGGGAALDAGANDVAGYLAIYQRGLTEGWHIRPEVFSQIKVGSVEQDPLVYGSTPTERSWCAFKFTSHFGAMQAAADAAEPGTRLAMATWPSVNVARSNYVKPSMFFAISRDCRNPRLAARYLDFYLNDGDAAKAMGNDRGLPVNATLSASITGSLDGADRQAADFLARVVEPASSPISAPAPARAAEINATLLPGVEESVLYGKEDAATAAVRFVREANEALGGGAARDAASGEGGR